MMSRDIFLTMSYITNKCFEYYDYKFKKKTKNSTRQRYPYCCIHDPNRFGKKSHFLMLFAIFLKIQSYLHIPQLSHTVVDFLVNGQPILVTGVKITHQTQKMYSKAPAHGHFGTLLTYAMLLHRFYYLEQCIIRP